MAKHTSPIVDSGSIPPPSLHFSEMPHPLAKAMVKKEHYAHQQCQIAHAWGIQVDGKWLGVLTMGKMFATEANEGVCGKERSMDVLELNRVWLHDCLPRFTESRFIGWCMRQARKKNPNLILVSYADTATVTQAGEKKRVHIGVVYQATNWIYTGLTGTDKQKDKTIPGYRDYRSVPREKRGPLQKPCPDCGAAIERWGYMDPFTCKCGYVWPVGLKNGKVAGRRPWPGHILVPRSRKHRYVWFANAAYKALLRWKIQPYPKKEIV